MKRIFDCFTFFNEIDLLEFRLRECYNAVDHFVICEGAQTFQGNPKPLYFLENESRFAAFRDKIIYRVVEEMPTGGDHWAREHFQRNYIRKAVEDYGVRPDDIIVISDADEILNPQAFSTLRQHDGFFQIVMPMFQFYMNYLVEDARWTKPYAASWRIIQQIKDLSLVRIRQDETFARFGAESRRIEPGGWHFTFLGGPTRVRQKLAAYSHTETHIARLLQDGQAERSIQAGFDSNGRRLTKFTPVDQTFPEALTNNIQYYRELGFVRLALDRIKDLEAALQDMSDEIHAERENNKELWGKISGLVSGANGLLTPYRHPHFTEIAFGGSNLIPSSRDFSREWYNGVQSQPSVPSDDVPPFVFGSLVMRHSLDGEEVRPDNNVGWYDVEKSKFERGMICSASCYVWIPESSQLTNVYITLSMCEPVRSRFPDLTLRNTWQRISASYLIGAATLDSPWQQSTILRISAAAGATAYSTCWQFEIGPEVTAYKETVAR
jgi:beta-1,4-mannosyl-glycoprotein beta-1,4-N-acetylglucosaminyltransferase